MTIKHKGIEIEVEGDVSVEVSGDKLIVRGRDIPVYNPYYFPNWTPNFNPRPWENPVTVPQITWGGTSTFTAS